MSGRYRNYLIVFIAILLLIAGIFTFYSFGQPFEHCSKYRLTVDMVSTHTIENKSVQNFSELTSSQKEVVRSGVQEYYIEVSEQTYDDFQNVGYVEYTGDVYKIIPNVGHCPGGGFIGQAFQVIGILSTLVGLLLIVFIRYSNRSSGVN